MRIVLVSAESDFNSRLRGLLSEQGFRVETGLTADRGLELAGAADTSLVILDETSPTEGGYEILRRLRVASMAPVLMLLRWDTPEARIASLEAGADDCLGRPFHPRELTARVRSILRRSQHGAGLRILEANGILVDTASREVFFKGQRVELTTVEFDVLAALLRSAGRPVSRDELMESLYHRKATPFDRSIDMHVSHLRRKFVSENDIIKTVRGEGYQFCLPGQDIQQQQHLTRSAS